MTVKCRITKRKKILRISVE